MYIQHVKNVNHGYILLEIIIAVLIFGLLYSSALPILGFLVKRVSRSTVDQQANLLVQEGMEIAYSVLMGQWDGISNNTYATYLDTTTPQPQWSLVPAADDFLQAKYRRTISITTVTRDSITGEIGPGTIDPMTKKITTTLEWESGGQTKTIAADFYVLKTTF